MVIIIIIIIIIIINHVYLQPAGWSGKSVYSLMEIGSYRERKSSGQNVDRAWQ